MKNLFLLFILSLFVSNNLTAQNIDWQPMSDGERSSIFLTKQDNNVIYVVDSELDIEKREGIIADTRKSIAKNLDLLQEVNFDAPLYIFLIADRNRMYKFSGKKTLYSAYISEDLADISSISSVYDANHSPLNLGLMKAVVIEKWGKIKDDQLIWLEEGLSSYATPEAYNCDGYSFEERYAYFSHEKQLVNLLQFPKAEERIQHKIACNQSAYLVEYLLAYYGVSKLKQLWQGQMANFEEVYGITFDNLETKIRGEFNKKQTISSSFNWEAFNKDCIELDPNTWLPAYSPPSYDVNQKVPMFDGMETKEVENLKFTVASTMTMLERDSLIAQTQKYIAQNLELIGEQFFNDSVHIVTFSDRNEMSRILDGFVGAAMLKDDVVIMENIVYAVHSNKQSVLKHELMHIVALLKWGENPYTLNWLNEGLATLADLRAFDCDGHTLEERYVYFIQNDKLIDTEILLTKFFGDAIDDVIGNKTAYNQSAYIVGYLIENYEIEKLKRLWQSTISDFELIYNISFDDLILKINNELREKYPKPIKFNWESFSKNCIE